MPVSNAPCDNFLMIRFCFFQIYLKTAFPSCWPCFHDSDVTILNIQPLVTGFFGEHCSSFFAGFFDPCLVYKLQLRELADRLLFVQENVDEKLLSKDLKEEHILFLCEQATALDVTRLSEADFSAIFSASSPRVDGKGKKVSQAQVVERNDIDALPVFPSRRHGNAQGRDIL